MTRREELEARATDYVRLFVRSDAEPEAQRNLAQILKEVERECWQRVTEKIETEMAKEDGSTDDQIWEIRDWCDEQGKIA